jgi:hypothetical protein
MDMSENIGDGRPIRLCDVCGGMDDHPRHMVASPDGADEQIRHLDCCAAAGCPDGTCDALLENYTGSSGADLLAHLMEGARR